MVTKRRHFRLMLPCRVGQRNPHYFRMEDRHAKRDLFQRIAVWGSPNPHEISLFTSLASWHCEGLCYLYSSFHKQSTSSKVLYKVNLQAMWSEKSHVGLDFLTQLCAEKDPFLNVILPQAKYKQQSPLQSQLTSDVIREISCGFGFPHTALRWKGSVFECHPSTSKVPVAKSIQCQLASDVIREISCGFGFPHTALRWKGSVFECHPSASIHKQSTSSKVLYNVNLQVMWSEKSHVGLIREISCGFGFPHTALRWKGSVFECHPSTSKVQVAKSFTMSTYKRCDQRNLMWVWISSHSFALKRIRFWMSSFHKQSTSSKVHSMSTCKRCDQRNLMWVWISSHSFALKRIRFWMSSFHKQSTSSKVLYNVNLQAMWSEKSHVGLDFLTQLCAEKDPFLNVILPQAKYQ